VQKYCFRDEQEIKSDASLETWTYSWVDETNRILPNGYPEIVDHGQHRANHWRRRRRAIDK
jgi:hypothetical protein